MTKPHRATPEQWAQQALWVETYEDSSCIMELLHRIEALEAAQQKIRSGPESPLVERVADAIAAQATSAGIVNDRPARAAILEVAAWLRKVPWPNAATALEKEVER
jgi:hypothetical protein